MSKLGKFALLGLTSFLLIGGAQSLSALTVFFPGGNYHGGNHGGNYFRGGDRFYGNYGYHHFNNDRYWGYPSYYGSYHRYYQTPYYWTYSPYADNYVYQYWYGY